MFLKNAIIGFMEYPKTIDVFSVGATDAKGFGNLFVPCHDFRFLFSNTGPAQRNIGLN